MAQPDRDDPIMPESTCADVVHVLQRELGAERAEGVRLRAVIHALREELWELLKDKERLTEALLRERERRSLRPEVVG